MEKQPSYKNLTRKGYGRLSDIQHQPLQQLVQQHIESFNFAVDEGLKYAIENISREEMVDPTGRKIVIYIEDAEIGYPTISESNVYSKSVKTFPTECRERASSYKAKLAATFSWLVDGRHAGTVTSNIGQVPIMVKSSRCRLLHMGPKELVKHHEEAEEAGGYFIVNGIERIMRMLVMPRRNYPIAIIRPSWKSRGSLFTEYGVSVRSVRKDQTSSNLILHYLTDGSVILCLTRNKEQFFLPLMTILKALVDKTDSFIYNEIIRGSEDDTFIKGCVASMLRDSLNEELTSQKAVLQYVGRLFRVKLELPDWKTDEDVAKHLLKDLVCVHLTKQIDKFHFLVLATRKLFALVNGKCSPETTDSPMNQEILLAGHLYLMALKEKLENFLRYMKNELERQARLHPGKFDENNATIIKKVIGTGPDVGNHMHNLIATGNLTSKSGLGLQQKAGFTVVAEKLNYYRYLSHFRCVHRGAFFATMRTTAVRRLLPEAWGFLCPVHTPDGAPCGLLNHLATNAKVICTSSSTFEITKVLYSLGVCPLNMCGPLETLDVLLDGLLVGRVQQDSLNHIGDQLRVLKMKGTVTATLEIAVVPPLKCGQFPGLFLFSTPARMMRTVLNLVTQSEELIGTFEQVYLNIAVTPEEAHPKLTTHLELSKDNILSVVASLTPFSDFNQSPRNMYQCQMSKQTIGVPVHSLQYRMDNKLYKLQTPQTPMVRPWKYDHYGIDNYPLGTNAIVAVISYTGYDMEDAMILNKASHERGFAHATVYKSELIDISKFGDKKNPVYFGTFPGDVKTEDKLDPDGFPPIGTLLQEGDPYYCFIDESCNESHVKYYKSAEPAFIDQIKFLGNDVGSGPLQQVYVKFRIIRNPIIGDKFSSRHGQKGVCSQLWPVENMPFTESGMVPDIIFNPHGYPSRMTIGMMIESMAGKSASLHGLCHDASPFTFSEDTPAVDYFGQLLVKAGFNYYGNECMYSGITGREFEAEIFIGPVYYQRLRHMVSDKFQVRTTGPIDILTHQPVKGRKRAGGIRFGEMERDSLLAHGSSFLLQDRLLNCSDKSYCRVCTKCGSLISPVLLKPTVSDSTIVQDQKEWTCKYCEEDASISVISVSYVFRYLVAELAAMNIKVHLEVK
ncbi:DNA-directed RNA polymerase I subunit RPA2-like [Dysidea avara]|uniref:DNA-directed RNA polymerase I subunit RPA2-like n=1 Tax=Dysidea avara TaxID=196820 RepID=UPI003320CBB5